MINKHMKTCSTLLVIRKCKLKPQRNTPPHPLKWLKLNKLTMANVGEDVEQPRTLTAPPGRNVKQYHHLAESLVVSSYTDS